MKVKNTLKSTPVYWHKGGLERLPSDLRRKLTLKIKKISASEWHPPNVHLNKVPKPIRWAVESARIWKDSTHVSWLSFDGGYIVGERHVPSEYDQNEIIATYSVILDGQNFKVVDCVQTKSGKYSLMKQRRTFEKLIADL